MSSKFYINLGIVFITVHVRNDFFNLAYSQISLSRYGQALTSVFPADLSPNIYFFNWDIEYQNNYWKVTVDENKCYIIKKLSLLGVHNNNTNHEIAKSFEDILYTHFIAFHASMVANNDGEAILICGRSGCGKTTLAKALVDSGYSYVSDDMALIDDNLNCEYFRTSPHIRCKHSVDTHMVGNEHRKFEIIDTKLTSKKLLKLKYIIVLNSLAQYQIEFKTIFNTFKKFQMINSYLIGYPNCDYVFAVSKKMLTLPVYSLTMARNENINEIVKMIGEKCQKQVK